MHFDLTDIRVFVQVAEQKSITKGAEKMHLSLPAVSTRIKELERRVGVRLLYRAPRGVALTPAGQVLLQHALTLLSDVENLKSDMHLFCGGVKGHIRVFANTTAVSDFMPEVLAGFLVKYPNVDIDLQERLAPEIIRGVLDSTTDMGIISGSVSVEGLEKHHFSTDQLVLVISPDHPLSTFDKINFVQAIDYDFIGLPERTSLQSFLNMLLHESNKRLLLRVQVNSFEAMCRMIEAGVGIGIVPKSAALRHKQTMKIELKEVDETWATRERYVLTRKGAAITSHTQELIRAIRAYGQRVSVES